MPEHRIRVRGRGHWQGIYVARRIHPKGTSELSLSLKALVCMKTLFHFTNRSIQLAFGYVVTTKRKIVSLLILYIKPTNQPIKSRLFSIFATKRYIYSQGNQSPIHKTTPPIHTIKSTSSDKPPSSSWPSTPQGQ